MAECRSTFDDVVSELRGHASGVRLNAMFAESRDQVADGMSAFLDELAVILTGRLEAQRVLDEAQTPRGMFAHPDETRLQEIVEVRDRMLRARTDAALDSDWRRGVEFAAWCLMGAAMRDLSPISADYQRHGAA